MATGTVKSFNAVMGFGFIEQDDGPDVFVHFSKLQTQGSQKLQAGDRVEYEVTQGPQGLQADKVRLL